MGLDLCYPKKAKIYQATSLSSGFNGNKISIILALVAFGNLLKIGSIREQGYVPLNLAGYDVIRQ